MPRKPRRGSGAPTAPFLGQGEVYRTLLKARLRKDTRLGVNSPAVVHLTNVLNIIQWKVRAGPRHEVSDEPAKIIRREGLASSIPSTIERKRAWEEWVRDGIWPAVRQGYEIPSGHTRWSMLDLANLQGDLAESERRLRELCDERDQRESLRFEEEIAARRRDQEIAALKVKIEKRRKDEAKFLERTNAARAARRCAVESAQPILDKREVAEWKHFAVELGAIFHAALPGQSKKAADRFIAVVVPAITGENPTPNAVEQFLKQRLVKGRERASKVKHRRV